MKYEKCKVVTVINPPSPYKSKLKDYCDGNTPVGIDVIITSDEPIKVGDYWIDSREWDPAINKVHQGVAYNMYTRKVVATTCTYVNDLPRPSKEFMKKFISMSCSIKFINVLYTKKNNEFGPLIQSDNTIVIKRVNKMYSKSEVVSLLYKYNRDLAGNGDGAVSDLKEWIEKNIY